MFMLLQNIVLLPFKIIYNIIFFSIKRIFFIFLFVFILWFIPWTPTLLTGVLVYFPYHQNADDRYTRIIIKNVLNWTNEQNLPISCKTALVAAEDTKFYEHNGIDFEALTQVYEKNKKYHKNKRGASTITQQLVKNAFLSRNKNYIRKLREIIGALSLDLILSKNEQIMWYLNIVEFGSEIYGIENAVRFYFKTDITKITPSQCITLISILPSPNKWSTYLKKGYLSNFLQKRYKIILERMIIMNKTPTKEIAYAKTHSPFGTKNTHIKIVTTSLKDGENIEDIAKFDDDNNSADNGQENTDDKQKNTDDKQKNTNDKQENIDNKQENVEIKNDNDLIINEE